MSEDERMDVPEHELADAAQEVIHAAEQPSRADVVRARDYLRAAELARAYCASIDPGDELHHRPFRSFILGYLAGIRDRT